VESEKKIEWDLIVNQAKTLWEMASPYYKESKSGRWLFAGMVGITLVNSAVSVGFSYLGKDFWNALSAKDAEVFYANLIKYGAALVIGAPVSVLYRFQRERLAVNWRDWMTERTLQLYSGGRTYYLLESSSDIDNPDQRITEDVRSFTGFSLQLFITIVTSIIDLVSFSMILYSIQPQLFGAIIAYSAFGTIVTSIIGGKLVNLNFLKLQREADFRYSLVRLRENAESIAFYGGEDLEGKSIAERLQLVIQNKKDLIGAQRNLETFTTAYQYLIQIVPVAVVAPQYFAGTVLLGVVSQSAGAFNHILSDLSIIVNQFEQLSSFSAGIDRLSSFYTEMRELDPNRSNDMSLLQLANMTKPIVVNFEDTIHLQKRETMSTVASQECIVSVKDLTLSTPDRKRTLIHNLNLELQEGQNLVIVGDSGAGKSSLLRAIAGLWTAGEGQITRPDDGDVYFLPQRPYCAMGTLRDQLLYPSLESGNEGDFVSEEGGHVVSSSSSSRSHLLPGGTRTDDELLEILHQVTLGDLAARMGDGDPIAGLKAVADWSNMLSLGEQQRLAFGRILVNRPKLVILDEATSALDMISELKMYQLLQNMARKTMNGGTLSAPGLTYISVGHRPSLLAYHDKKLRLGDVHEVSDIENKATVDIAKKISNL
jgi:ABC-type uncharacterized transport system fused permease/ATPase subunit